MSALRRHALRAWRAAEAFLDRAFGADSNPLRHLGALGFLCFWTAAVTGILLYVAFDTSVAGAWQSVRALDAAWLGLGGPVRSLHRYASDAFVLVVGLHLVRELVAGHAAGFRWFSWLSGVPLVVLLYASGLVGFWLVWDEVALYSFAATAEWIDALGMLPDPLVRNILVPDLVIDRLFTLFIFLHIGVPLALLAGMWIHVQRVSRPAIQPSRPLALGTLFALAALSIAWPATIAPQADISRVPAVLALDWFYLAPHPVADATSPAFMWVLATVALALLAAAPWLMRARPLVVPVVSPADCNGCGRCFADCPYSAITLVPHVSKRRAPRMVEVDPSLCAGCGICAGACPSSTPFRAAEDFASGIDLPGRRIADLRGELERGLAAIDGSPRVAVFGCDCAARVGERRRANRFVLGFPCIGMLPPSFVEYALRSGADGVLIAPCVEGGCEYRFGPRLLAERFAGAREPRLRANVPRERVCVVGAGEGGRAALEAAIGAFENDLRALGPAAAAPARRQPSQAVARFPA